MIRTGCLPDNWDSSNVRVIGLADDENILKKAKVIAFTNVPYSKARALLTGKYNFYFELTYVNGTIIKDSGNNLTAGLQPLNERFVVPIDRYVVYEDKPIKLGLQVGPASTLLFVANDEGFFEQEGLNIELIEFTAGKFALQAFLAGSIDLAASGEVPVMYSSLQGNEFYIISQVVEKTINEVRIVAQKEEGLNDPEDYFKAKKRKLATSFGGGPEFYTYNFLKKHDIKDIELISQKPEDMPVALQSGTVDAIAIFEPFAFFAEQKLGDRAITFKDDSMYSELYVLNAKKEWVAENPQIVEKILRALVKAEEFIEKKPDESKQILIKYTKLDKETVDGIWDNFVYKPALNELLLKYLNAEARWAIETGKVKPDTKIPDFNEYIYKESLRKIKPESVTI